VGDFVRRKIPEEGGMILRGAGTEEGPANMP